MSYEVIGWLIAIVVFIAAEAATVALVSVWFIGGAVCALITRLQTRCVCFSVSGCMGSPSFAPLYAPRRRIVRFHKKLPVKIVIFHDFVPEKSCISRMTVLKFFFVRFLCTKLSGKEGRGAKYDAG